MNKLLSEKDEKKILKNSAIYNSIAGVLSSCFVSILLMMITRTGNVELAGLFSIASVIAYQCLTIGNFATYHVQVSDMKNEFSFNDFVGAKVIAIILMYIALLFFSFCSGYELNKAAIVLSFGVFKSIDAVDDVFRAEYHRNKRLDIGSIILISRYIVALSVFTICFAFTKDLMISSLIAAVILLAFTIVSHKKVIVYFVQEKIIPEFKKMKELLGILVPLTISNYIRTYVVNVPKYAIDMYLLAEAQTYYGILVMPAMIINMLADIIFAPFIPKLSELWNANIKQFIGLMIRQILVIFGLTVITMLGGYIIGLDLLSWVYAVDLSNYMGCLLLLLIAGGLNAASVFMSLVLTIERMQKWTVAVYVMITATALFLSKAVIINYEIVGACVLYCGICLANFLSFVAISSFAIHRQKKNGRNDFVN